MRSHDNDDQCVVLGRWGDWLAQRRPSLPYDYYIGKLAEPQQWPIASVLETMVCLRLSGAAPGVASSAAT